MARRTYAAPTPATARWAKPRRSSNGRNFGLGRAQLVAYIIHSISPSSRARVTLDQQPQRRQHAFAAAFDVREFDAQTRLVNRKFAQNFRRAHAKRQRLAGQNQRLDICGRHRQNFVRRETFNRDLSAHYYQLSQTRPCLCLNLRAMKLQLKPIDEQVAVVMGATSGIGRATALLLAQKGARVVVAARRQDALDDLVEEI